LSLFSSLPGRENELRWIIYDGDVDALWVENMNSVMDDNKLLTLPNGERIRLQNYCKMMYEVYDLQYASPATISRCGMVYVDPKNLGYRPFYVRWVKLRCGPTNHPTEAGLLMELFDKCVGEGVESTVLCACICTCTCTCTHPCPCPGMRVSLGLLWASR
jgi:dynein heavy chain